MAASLGEGHKLLVAESNQGFPYTGLQWINKYSWINKYHWHQVSEEPEVGVTLAILIIGSQHKG